jgi:hypothetical protein
MTGWDWLAEYVQAVPHGGQLRMFHSSAVKSPVVLSTYAPCLQ